MSYQEEINLRSTKIEPYSADLSSLQFDYPTTISRPDQILATTTNPGLSVEITHAATLTSDQVIKDGAIDSKIIDYFQSLSKAGINAIYTPGVYEPAKFSEMIMPFFASRWNPAPNFAHVGPSVFSIDDYSVRSQIGSWENFEKLVLAARQYGHELIVDFIPNTIGIGSSVARAHPEFVRDYPAPEFELEYLERLLTDKNLPLLYLKDQVEKNESSDVHHQVKVVQKNNGDEIFVYSRALANRTNSHTIILQRNRGVFSPHAWVISEYGDGKRTIDCKQLGTDGGTVWADVFMLKTDSPAVKKWHAAVLAHLATKVNTVRIDMAHLPNPEYYSDLRKIISEQGWKAPILWGEAYGCGSHDTLAYRGVTTYAGFIRNWLRQDPPDISALNRMLYEVASGATFFGRNYSIAYTANHDDSHASPGPKEGALAAIVCTLPVPVVMWAQGQRYGDPRRYGSDQHVPMDDYLQHIREAQLKDPDFYDFMHKLTLLSKAPIFRSRTSSWHPAYFTEISGKDSSAIFHIARNWRNFQVDGSSTSMQDGKAEIERVFAVVDCQPYQAYGKIVVDIAKTCRLDSDAIDRYLLINLIDGQVFPAQECFELRPPQEGVGYDVHIYALFPKEAYEQMIAREGQRSSSSLSSQAKNDVLNAKI